MAAKHILACVDFSEHSIRALQQVAEQARTQGSRVTLVHVIDPHGFVPPQAVLEPSTTTERARHEQELAKVRDSHLPDLEVDIAVIEEHSPARAICEYAASHDVDLIVVGSHGRSAVERLLIGSVAERVVRHANANVYVVRH